MAGGAGALPGDDTSVELTIYDGGTTTGAVQETKAVSFTGTTWSYTTPTLANGTYTAQVTQEDQAGNVGVSAAVTFTVDTVAPVVSITPLATPSKNATPTLSGGAGTAGGDDATVSVKILQGVTVVQAASVPVVAGEWTYTATKLADGTYTAQATQEDGAGNVGSSATITFTVDTTPPVVSVKKVTSPTSDATPTFTGSGGVLSGDDASVTVTVYKGGAVGGTVAASASVPLSGSTWSYTPAALVEGVYTVRATQEDKAGNLGVSAAETFTVDLTAPVVSVHPLVSPTNDATPTLSGGAGTAGGDDATVSVKILQGVTVVQAASVPVVAGEWTYTATKLADGTYTAQATQEDGAGNVGSSATITFTVDTTPPVVSVKKVTSPTSDATPTFTGSGGVLSGDDASVTVTVYKGGAVGGTVAASASVPLSGSTWSYTPAALVEGVYTVRATQEDKAGNLGVSAAETFTVDTVAPVVSITPLATPSKNATPTLSGGAGTAGGDDATVSVKILQGVTVVQAASVPVVAGEWTYTATKLADGTYTAQATQEDGAGNVGLSATITFTVDTVAPLVTLHPVTSPTNNPTPKLSGLAGTAPGDHATVVVKIYQGATVTGTVVEAVSVATSGSEWSYTPARKLVDGVYTAQATQGDTAENVGASAASTFTVDTTAPLISIRAVPSPAHNPTPALSGTAGVAAGDAALVAVKIYKGTVALGTPVQSASVPVSTGEWSLHRDETRRRDVHRASRSER